MQGYKLAFAQSRNSKIISFKSNLHTESTKDSVTIRFLSRHETMLCRSNFFVLFIEEPIYHCTLALSYSEKECQSNDTLIHFVEFSNVHNSDRSANATRSNLVYKDV